MPVDIPEPIVPIDTEELYLKLLDPNSYSQVAVDNFDIFRHEYTAHGNELLKAADTSPGYLWSLMQHASYLGQIWLIAVLACLLVVAVVYGIRDWRRGEPPIIFMAIAGGAVWSFSEPLWDILGHLYIYENGVDHWFTFLGRSQGPWVVVAYAYAGLVSYVAYRFVRDGATFNQWKWALVVAVLANVVLEVPATRLGLYHYWGTQPLMIDKFPLHWAFINQGGLFAGVLVGVASRFFTGWRVTAMVPLYFCCATGYELFVGTPSYLALNANGLYSDPPMWVATVGALISIGLSSVCILTVGYLASRSPVATAARRRRSASLAGGSRAAQPAAATEVA